MKGIVTTLQTVHHYLFQAILVLGPSVDGQSYLGGAHNSLDLMIYPMSTAAKSTSHALSGPSLKKNHIGNRTFNLP